MGARYLVDIFVPDFSEGLMVDARVLQRVIGSDRARVVPVSGFELDRGPGSDREPMPLEPQADTAIFIERLFEHEALGAYPRRVLLPNPEWLSARDVDRGRRILTEVWHKTRFSVAALSGLLPAQRHQHLGFTSFQNAPDIESYESIGHFAGKSKTRHTQDLVDLWLANPGWPALSLQFFSPMGVSIPKWIDVDNLRVHLGFLPTAEYHAEVRRHGVQVCTSQMEGFGHYINEARALGALCIVLDAPPMNELIDTECGLLVPVERQAPYNFGTRFYATPEAIRAAVEAALSMPIEIRRTMGSRARERYLAEQQAFVGRVMSCLS